MARNICLDCGCFLSCKKACAYIEKCDDYVKDNRKVIKVKKGGKNVRFR